ncbi:MAG: Gfo/Idh/MocA family protein [Gemmatimonadota bacterium]
MRDTGPPLGVALLGCGRIARRFHLPLLARMPSIGLRLVAEPDAAVHQAVRSIAPGATVLSDWKDALAGPGVQAVVIALPTALHAPAACAAFEAGLAVYLEKPIATTRAEADQVVAAWRASGRIGMLGFNARFDPAVIALRRAMAEGRAGRVIGARLAIGGGAEALPGWKQSRATGGGVVLDLGGHAVDLARLLFGQEIASVTATVSTTRAEDDTACLTLKLTGGALVQAFVNLAGVQESVIEIVGDGGVLVADRSAGTVVRRPPRPAYGRFEQLRRLVATTGAAARNARGIVRPFDDAASFRAALTAFVAAVKGEPLEGADIEEGHRNLTILLAAEASARVTSPRPPPHSRPR